MTGYERTSSLKSPPDIHEWVIPKDVRCTICSEGEAKEWATHIGNNDYYVIATGRQNKTKIVYYFNMIPAQPLNLVFCLFWLPSEIINLVRSQLIVHARKSTLTYIVIQGFPRRPVPYACAVTAEINAWSKAEGKVSHGYRAGRKK